MIKKLLPLSILIASTAGQVCAENYYPFHARAMAMGNTGVASARSSGAAFFNPSLMSQQKADRDFEMLFPVVGVFAADDDELIDSLDEIDDGGYVDNFTNAVDDFNTLLERIDAGDPGVNQNGITTATSGVTTSLDELNQKIQTLDQNTLRANAGGGLVVAIPSKKYAMAFTATARASIGVVFNYNDAQLVNSYITAMDALGGALNPNQPTSTIDPNDPRWSLIAEEDENGDFRLKEPTLDSDIQAVALLVTELGLPMSREFEIAGEKIAIGLTPKYVSVKTYDYTARVVEEGEDGIDDVSDAIEDSEETDSNFNLDVGASYQIDKWTTGITVRNVLSQEYETVSDRTFEIKPQVRVGTAYNGDWFTAAVDLDATEQDGLFEDQETQYLSAGVEFNLADIAQLRAGYSHNLSDSQTDMYSAGIGLSPFGIMIELAATVAPDIDAAGAALQLGFRF